MKKLLKNKKLLSIVVLSLAVITNAAFLLGLTYIHTFSTLSKNIFIIINVIVLVMLLGINFLSYLQMRNTKRNYFYMIISVVVLGFLLASGFTFVAGKLNQTVNNIVVSDPTVTESLELAITVNEKENASIKDINDLDGKTIGILQENLSAEIFKASQSEFENQNVDVEFKEYFGYQEIILALLKNEIDGGILPANYRYMFASDDKSDEDYMKDVVTIATYSRDIEYENETVSDIDVANEPFSVLLIGMDEQHSDVLMIATFNPLAFEISYTSIPRDSLVSICGNSRQKITHSRNYGRGCTIKSVEDLMEIDIDYYFETNFKGVVDMVDALGGIPIDSPLEFVGQTSSYDRGTKTIKIFKGLHHLDGEQALAFARERHAFINGDFQRQMNQQQVITSFLSELVRIRDVNKALKVLDAAGENVRTNIPVDTMMDIFNLVLNKVDRSYEQSFAAIDIKSTRLTGYGSSQYDEKLEWILWIYRLWNGSIAENKAFILGNLDLMNIEIKAPDPLKWNANWAYSRPVLFNEYFNEKEVHDPLPDLVGSWAGKNISELRTWANDRGIKVVVHEVKEGAEGFVAEYGNGYILSQDAPAARLAKKVSEINVSVITVLPRVPDFSVMSTEDINNTNWSEKFGFTVSIKRIKSHNSDGTTNTEYVAGKVGQFAKQSIPTGTEVNGSFSNVDVYLYDYPYVTTALPKASDGLDAIKAWANTHLTGNSGDKIVYGESIITTNQAQDGKVFGLEAIKNGEPYVKSNGQISVVLYKYVEEQPITIPNFVGGPVETLTAFFANHSMSPVGSVGADCGEGNPVVILSVSGLDGITSIKPSELKKKTVTYTYCKAFVPPTDTETDPPITE